MERIIWITACGLFVLQLLCYGCEWSVLIFHVSI